MDSHGRSMLNSDGLLKSLNDHLTADGVSVILDRDYQQAKEELRRAKLKWLQLVVLCEEVKELSLFEDRGSRDLLQDYNDKRCGSLLATSLSLSEITDYLDMYGCHNLLGITPSDLRRLYPSNKIIEFVQRKHIAQLQDRLRVKYKTISDFYAPPLSIGDWKAPGSSECSELPLLVESDKRRLQKETAALKKMRQGRDEEFWLCYKAILRSLESLEKFASDENISKRVNHDTRKAEFLLAKCDTLALKIRMMELQVLSRTYDAETVPALHCVKRQLDDELTSVQEEQGHVSQSLRAYAMTGPGFEKLVSNYANLKREIENKQWAVSELRSASGS